jgi:hypothetical protein
MPLAPSFTVVQDNGGLLATATNTTTYGGANQDRNEAAEYVLWSKTDKDGNRVFTNPDQGDVLTKLIYSVSAAVSGLYELIWLRFQFYDAGTPYVEEQTSGGNITQYASVFYYGTTGKVYKAIVPSTGQNPEDTNYFVEVPLASLYTLLGNTNLEQYIKNFDGLYAINKCITGRLAGEGCNCESSDKEYNMDLFSKYLSATSNFNAGNIYEFQALIEELNTACVEC